MGYAILRLEVDGIMEYVEDVVFLVIADDSKFSQWVPLIMGTPMLGWVLNMARESKLDNLATPWVVTRFANGLSSHKGTVRDNVANKLIDPEDMDEPVFTKHMLMIPPFQTVLVHGQMNLILTGYKAHVMISPPSSEDFKTKTSKALPLGLQVLHAYTDLKNGSDKVAVAIRNTSDATITLKKG